MLADSFTHPIDPVASFGYRFMDVLEYGSGGYHTGDDYNGPGAGDADYGMAVRAIGNGEIVLSGNCCGFGNYTVIKHRLTPELANRVGASQLYSRYMHLIQLGPGAGNTVTKGQAFGQVGKSGGVIAHCHLDMYRDNMPHNNYPKHDPDYIRRMFFNPYATIEANRNPTVAAVNFYEQPISVADARAWYKNYGSMDYQDGWPLVPKDILVFIGDFWEARARGESAASAIKQAEALETQKKLQAEIDRLNSAPPGFRLVTTQLYEKI